MTPLEKQIIINHCLKDFVYFKNHYLAPNKIDEFIKRIQEGSEQMFIRAKISARLNEVSLNNVSISKSKNKPKNGAKIDLKKIIEDNKTDLKL